MTWFSGGFDSVRLMVRLYFSGLFDLSVSIILLPDIRYCRSNVKSIGNTNINLLRKFKGFPN